MGTGLVLGRVWVSVMTPVPLPICVLQVGNVVMPQCPAVL